MLHLGYVFNKEISYPELLSQVLSVAKHGGNDMDCLNESTQ